MVTSARPCNVSRRWFVGCSSASVIPLAACGKVGPQRVVPHHELERRFAEWAKRFSSTIHVDGARNGMHEYHVVLHRNQWSGFYQSLAENFPSPQVREDNLIELRRGTCSVRLRVA